MNASTNPEGLNMQRSAPESPIDSGLGKVFKRELIEKAYTILGGIPTENVELDAWVQNSVQPSCGTLACGLGWLTMHPYFTRLGLQFSSPEPMWAWPVADNGICASTQAAFALFVVNPNHYNCAYLLFDGYEMGGWDHELDRHYVIRSKHKHHDLLMARLHYAYHHHSQ